MFKQITLFFFLISSFLTKAQHSSMEALTIEDGLSQGMIFDIAKDQDGFMWFATKNGLNRYDGYNFKVFNNSPYDSTSLPSLPITRLLVDSQNRLWVNSAFLYDRNLEIFYNLNKKIKGLIEDKEGNLWCFFDKTIYQLKVLESKNKDTPLFQLETKATLTATIYVLKGLSDGTILVGTREDGLFKLNTKTNQVTSLFRNIKAAGNIIEYPKGTIWISGKKLYRIQDGRLSPVKLTLSQQTYDAKGIKIKLNSVTKKIWFQDGNRSIVYEIDPFQSKTAYDLDKVEKIVLEDAKLYPTCFYLEEDRTLWIGTNGYGIRKTSLQKNPFHHLLIGKSIRSNITLSKKGVLSASHYRPEETKGTKVFIETSGYPSLVKSMENGILQTKDGVHWMVETSRRSEDFLIQMNEDLEEEQRYPLGDIKVVDWNFNSFIEGKDNHLWFSSFKGLIKFDRKKKISSLIKRKYIKEKIGYSLYLYQDTTGVFWNCTEKGLLKITIDKTGKTVEHFYENDPTDIHSLSNNVVAAVHDDPIAPLQYLWVATKGGGLNKLDKKTGKFEHFTKKDGLPNNIVYSVLPDDEGYLWLSTNHGLSKFNPRTKVFLNFLKADGLQDNEFNTRAFLKDEKTGILYFGGINGITAFHPKDVQLSTFKPKVHISQIKIHGETLKVGQPLQQRGKNPLNKAIEYTKKIRLPWYQNQITLDFASLDFSNPDKNLYQYQLSSIDRDWVQAGNRRSVNYSNLEIGTYIFRLKATNSDGRWNDEETILIIEIYPPWYRTYWAYGIYFILSILGIYKLYQNQLRRAKLRTELAFEQKEAARLAEIDKIKTNFFSNITHEFRTPLTLIIEPLRQYLKNPKKEELSKVKLAKRNSERLLVLVNQLLDLSKLESKKMTLELKRGNFGEFVTPIIQSFQTLAKQKEIQFTYHVPNELFSFDFDKNKVEKVLYNLISNAIKFTKSKGSVTVNIIEKTETEQLQIQVIDTGIGISTKEQPHIFDRFYQVDGSNTREQEGTGIGLALSKELAEVMNGQLIFKSELGKGSAFEFFIPMVQIAKNAIISTQKEVINIEPQAIIQHSEPTININPDATNIALIIEDNDELREFIKSSIEDKYEVITAKNGQIGLELALKYIPNIIISDLMMPIMDGFEVCQKVKTTAETAHIPVILLTAKTAMKSRIKGLKYGADAYMNKPFSTEELLIRMKNLIEVRQKLQQKFRTVIKTVELKSIEQVITNKSILSDVELSSYDETFLKNAYQSVSKNLANENLTVEILAKEVVMSRSQLHRKLRALLNETPSEFIRNIRLKEAYQLLKDKKGNVREIAFMVGFSNPKYFSTKFKEKYNVSPRKV